MTAGAPALPAWLARVRQRAFRHAPEDRDAVILRHSRIYVLPTRRGLAVIGTLATMLLASLNYALSLGFVVTFLLTGLVGAALLHTFRNLAGLEIRPLAAAETFAGTPLAFTVALAARGFARSSVAVTATRGVATSVDIDADGHAIARIDVDAPMRGRVALGRVTLSSDFPLGLWRAWAYVHFPLTGLAYPQPETGVPALPAASSGAGEGADPGHDDADLAGLREYQPGDPLQRVAWKAVARGGAWFTKAFEGAGGRATLVLDWNATPGSLSTESRLSRLCAWVLACDRAMRPYALRLPGAELPAATGHEHRQRALTLLALFPEASS